MRLSSSFLLIIDWLSQVLQLLLMNKFLMEPVAQRGVLVGEKVTLVKVKGIKKEWVIGMSCYFPGLGVRCADYFKQAFY